MGIKSFLKSTVSEKWFFGVVPFELASRVNVSIDTIGIQIPTQIEAAVKISVNVFMILLSLFSRGERQQK
jgi:hypothetical protein